MTLKSLAAALATTALVTTALAAFAPPGLAQDKTGPNVDATASGAHAGASTYAIAQDLYALGMANKDALTVLTAARLAASVDLKEGAEIQKETKGEAREEEADVADAPVDAAMMLASARELAAGDDTLLGLIEEAQADAARGPIGGAVRYLSRLPAGRTDVWEVPFYGNSYAEMAVIGDGDANLDVLVTDENGNTICTEISYSDKITCDVVPAWNGYFYITVQNNGRKRNSYYLLTN